jgi:hypothetical protein
MSSTRICRRVDAPRTIVYRTLLEHPSTLICAMTDTSKSPLTSPERRPAPMTTESMAHHDALGRPIDSAIRST